MDRTEQAREPKALNMFEGFERNERDFLECLFATGFMQRNESCTMEFRISPEGFRFNNPASVHISERYGLASNHVTRYLRQSILRSCAIRPLAVRCGKMPSWSATAVCSTKAHPEGHSDNMRRSRELTELIQASHRCSSHITLLQALSNC